MKRPLSDTDPEVERVHIRLLSEAGPARRLAIALSLSQTAKELSLSALRKRNPCLSEDQIALKWVALCYGEDLARRVGVYLESRRSP